ncbi:MAG: cellulose synthase family protein [Pseudomonadota bacterium]
MEILAASLVAGHYLLLISLCIFGAHRFFLTVLAVRKQTAPETTHRFEELPLVTVQLPIYNEKFVVRRLLDAAAALDYPRERLQIQVLDDSTDESVELVAELVAGHVANGVWMEHVRRVDRQGYKAGALQMAMDDAKGDFIAIFDADFVPDTGFLQRVIHHLADPSVGMVQTRWDFINRNDDLLSKLQGIMLDAHFAIEQSSRFATNTFFNFNGTAGVWRRQAITDAGGWEADTLTEDLDLSYRAQMAGWRFVYLRDERCPSELPGDMNAFKSQQHRWVKGGIEVMRKLLGRIWRAPTTRHQKIEATLHLASNLSHFLILIDCVFFLLPAILVRQSIFPYPPIWIDLLFFFFAGLSHMFFYAVGQYVLGRRSLRHIYQIPALLGASIGLSVNNGRAVWEALVGHVSGFVRTPKQGDSVSSTASFYVAKMPNLGRVVEFALGIAYTAAALWCFASGLYVVLPFLVMFAFGFLFTSLARATPRQVAAA